MYVNVHVNASAGKTALAFCTFTMSIMLAYLGWEWGGNNVRSAFIHVILHAYDMCTCYCATSFVHAYVISREHAVSHGQELLRYIHRLHMPRPFHVNMMLVMHRNCYAPCFSHACAMSREHDASHAQELLLDMVFTCIGRVTLT